MHYGKLASDVLAEENKVARDIVREIAQFGINERQKILVMYLLSLELENVNDMKKFSSFIKSEKSDIFIAPEEAELWVDLLTLLAQRMIRLMIRSK